MISLVGMGVIDHIKQLCNLDALNYFKGTNSEKLKVNKLKHEFAKRQKEYGSLSGLYELSTSPKSAHEGKRIVLEIKQIFPPKLIK